MENANITRGKKWLDFKKKAEFEEDQKTLDWLLTQKSIVEDMEAFEKYYKPVETKSKEKK